MDKIKKTRKSELKGISLPKIFNDDNYVKELELKAKEDVKNWSRHLNIDNKRQRTKDILSRCSTYGDLINIDFKNKRVLNF